MRKIFFGIVIFFLLCTYSYAGCGDNVDVSGVSYVVERESNGYYIVFSGFENLFPGQEITNVRGNLDGGSFLCDVPMPHSLNGRFNYDEYQTLGKRADNKWYLKVPYDWIVKIGSNTIKLVFTVDSVAHVASEIITINRPTIDIPSIGEKYSFIDTLNYNYLIPPDVGDDYTVENRNFDIEAAFPYEDENLKYKIGIIRDLLLIESLKNNESNALNNLLQYAKNDNSVEFQVFFDPYGQNRGYSYDDWDIKENVIYYFYVDYNDPGYSNTEGITVLQGISNYNNTFLTNEVDYSKMSNALYAVAPDNNVDDNPNSNNDVNNNTNNDTNNDQIVNKPVDTGTVDNPGTGLYIGIGLIVLLMFMFCLSRFNEKKIYKI